MDSIPFKGRSSEMRTETPWLASEDLLGMGDVRVTIEHVFLHKNVRFEAGAPKPRVFSLKFKGKQKQLVLNATNRKTLVAKFGTTDTTKWLGQEVSLYVDPNVQRPGGKTGERTCGIRIRASRAPLAQAA